MPEPKTQDKNRELSTVFATVTPASPVETSSSDSDNDKKKKQPVKKPQ
jgi:hypothetical protein